MPQLTADLIDKTLNYVRPHRLSKRDFFKKGGTLKKEVPHSYYQNLLREAIIGIHPKYLNSSQRRRPGALTAAEWTKKAHQFKENTKRFLQQNGVVAVEVEKISTSDLLGRPE